MWTHSLESSEVRLWFFFFSFFFCFWQDEAADIYRQVKRQALWDESLIADWAQELYFNCSKGCFGLKSLTGKTQPPRVKPSFQDPVWKTTSTPTGSTWICPQWEEKNHPPPPKKKINVLCLSMCTYVCVCVLVSVSSLHHSLIEKKGEMYRFWIITVPVETAVFYKLRLSPAAQTLTNEYRLSCATDRLRLIEYAACVSYRCSHSSPHVHNTVSCVWRCTRRSAVSDNDVNILSLQQV